MQLKKLVVALGVAAGLAQGAHAAISVGNESTSQPPGELFLTVYNPTTQVTYTRDLGLDLDGYPSAGNPFSTNFNQDITFAADPSFAAAFPSTQGLVYAVAGINLYQDLTSPNAGYNVFVTSNGNEQILRGISTIDAIPTIFDTFRQWSEATNTAAGNNNFGTDSTSVINGTVSNGSFGGSFVTNGTWGNGFQSQSTAAAIGTPLAFYLLAVNLETGESVNQKFERQWLLDAQGGLTYSGSGPVVPLPPAVWLLGSALAGLYSIARKRNARAAAA